MSWRELVEFRERAREIVGDALAKQATEHWIAFRGKATDALAAGGDAGPHHVENPVMSPDQR